jgi:hypothetical protein
MKSGKQLKGVLRDDDNRAESLNGREPKAKGSRG